jgi:hypothetical protein
MVLFLVIVCLVIGYVPGLLESTPTSQLYARCTLASQFLQELS